MSSVLVAEDEEYNFLLIREILNYSNIDFLHAKNGQEAIDILQVNPSVQLVLMDLKMPVMGGYEAAIHIKQRRPDLPIIVQSAYTIEQDIAKYKHCFDDYISKPLSEEKLLENIYIHITQ